MPYRHGIYIQENPTPIVPAVTADSAVQVVVGVAPVNLLTDPAGAVNKPILVNGFTEAVSKIGYSDAFTRFSLCQAIDMSLRVFNVGPLILINVLDPEVHKASIDAALYSIVDRAVTIEVEGILLNAAIVVKDSAGVTTYDLGDDYTVAHNSDGHLVISILADGDIPAGAAQLSVAYDKIDPSAVDKDDIIGGYDAVTGVFTGLELIEQIFPQLGLVPGLIIAPGWSHIPDVAAAMAAKCERINGVFNCQCILDVDTTEVAVYSDVLTWKNTNGYTDKRSTVCWPMVKVGAKQYYMSALQAALQAYTDWQNDNVPYVSPSNKPLRITGAVLADGTEVYLDQIQANYLNGIGIATVLNFSGWRSWGNNTAAYPSTSDPKDRYIPARRMFDWWGNTFVLTYFVRVDSPLNFRLIESIVDSENVRANGYKARGQVADARIEFVAADNPIIDILNGTIRFKQYLTPYPPAEEIINVLEFDPNALQAALTGGEA